MENEEFVIDLEELKEKKLNENFSRMFAGQLELALGHMFGWNTLGAAKAFIKGKSSDVKSLAKALGHEKKYVDAMKKHGLDNPKTFKVKSRLDKAIKGFEKTTGIQWPFK